MCVRACARACVRVHVCARDFQPNRVKLFNLLGVVSCQLDASDGSRIEGNILYVDDFPEDSAVGEWFF